MWDANYLTFVLTIPAEASGISHCQTPGLI